MKTTRRAWVGAMAAGVSSLAAQQPPAGVTRYVRFSRENRIHIGKLDGETVRELRGSLFGQHAETGATFPLADVKLLAPVAPPKVLAVGLNYRSHLGERPVPRAPEMFYKPITCIRGAGDPIVIPADARNVHYEGELVIVIGKQAERVSVEEAKRAIFGVTCGNDVSERDWQNGPQKDLQWWRAKGADSFGPVGPCIAAGADYGNLPLQTRLNGKVVQKQSTSDLVFDCPKIVSFISHYVTLTPGDLIFTGTPGSTSKMNPGDVVEVEIGGIGILKNPVIQGRA